MSTFILAFFVLILVIVGMAVGVMVRGRTIKGSCGGLNALSDSDRCLVCSKEIDPNSPLKDRLSGCPKVKRGKT